MPDGWGMGNSGSDHREVKKTGLLFAKLWQIIQQGLIGFTQNTLLQFMPGHKKYVQGYGGISSFHLICHQHVTIYV